MSRDSSNAFFLKTYLNLINQLRESGTTFAEQNPEVAPYLDIRSIQGSDPEIERLIESFAFMIAQVEHKSILSQSEYLLQFIENILPEVTQPVPGLVMGHIKAERDFFIDDDKKPIINSGTRLKTTHTDGEVFYFSNPLDYELSQIQIKNVEVVKSSATSKNLYQHKRALIFEAVSLLPLNIVENQRKKIKFRFYINSDINNVLNIIDEVFSADYKIIFVDNSGNKFELARENLKIPFEFDSYTQKNNNSNCLYPLFDFCKFFEKYFYLEFTLPEYISIQSEFTLIVPLNTETKYKFNIKKNTFLDNCFPFFNFFKKNLKPIKTENNVYQYELHPDLLKSFNYEIIDINTVSTVHSASNNRQTLIQYHQRELTNKNDKNIYQDCYWVCRRSFAVATKKYGAVLLRLILTDDSVFLPEYLKIEGFCTNGKNVEKILPDSIFTVESGDLSFDCKTLSWIQAQESVIDIVEKVDSISQLFLINQKILSNSFDDVEDVLKVFEILSSTHNSVFLILQRVLNAVKSIDKVAKNDMHIVNGKTYFVPGYEFSFNFNLSKNIPNGFFFILNFLNGYFSYVRGLNFFIKFTYTVDEVRRSR